MDEKLKQFIDLANAKKKEERDSFLVSLNLTEGTRRVYGEHGGPFNQYDKEVKQWYYDTPIPIDVTDEEYSQIKELAPYFMKGVEAYDYYDEATNRADNKLSAFNAALLVLSILGGIACIAGSSQGYHTDPTLIGIGIATIFYGIFIWAIVRVFLSMSMNINRIRKNQK